MARQDFQEAQANFSRENLFGGTQNQSEADQHMADGYNALSGGKLAYPRDAANRVNPYRGVNLSRALAQCYERRGISFYVSLMLQTGKQYVFARRF